MAGQRELLVQGVAQRAIELVVEALDVNALLARLDLGLGFLGILFGRVRRALHDSIAGTAVVYTWDARAARLRSLARESRGRHSQAR